jgi:UDP-glucose 4-epimerase
VTKLAAEQLCTLYHTSHGVPTITLRYFTVYGPRQRPDMAIFKFIEAIAAGDRLTIHGSGEQRRDFVYVEDVVHANVLAALSPHAGMTVNVAGGHPVALTQLLELLQQIMGQRAHLVHGDGQPGDVAHTLGDCRGAQDAIGFGAATALADGLCRQVAWQTDHGAAARLRHSVRGQ